MAVGAQFGVIKVLEGGREYDVATFRADGAYPDARHPVVRTHPETGQKGLYVNVAFTSFIEGMEEKESDRLLRLLYRQASIPEYQCRFRWEVNSIAFWDNRATQHYATGDYYPALRRMHRITVGGDRPVGCESS